MEIKIAAVSLILLIGEYREMGFLLLFPLSSS